MQTRADERVFTMCVVALARPRRDRPSQVARTSRCVLPSLAFCVENPRVSRERREIAKEPEDVKSVYGMRKEPGCGS